jgi:DNA-binding response OmpR family regulator
MAKIMIISEDNELSIAMKHVMRREGHDVEIMPTFCESEAFLYGGGKTDMIFIDIDAIHHCRSAARATEKLKSISRNARVICLATKGQNIEPTQGADSIIYKPFTAHEIQTEVNHAVATH